MDCTPDFRPVTLDMKPLFDSYIKPKGYNCSCSESSFANDFIWQKSYSIRLSTHKDVMYLAMSHRKYRPLMLPPFLRDNSMSIQPYMLCAEDYMDAECGGFYLKGATEAVVEKIKQDCGDRYRFIYDDVNSEYVYNSSDLINLAGKKYHSKRNHINTFKKKYVSEFDEYSPKYREECLALQDKWAKVSGAEEGAARDEYESIARALDNYEALNLRGCVVKIGGEVVAFSMGEHISEDTAIIHIEKADRDFDGLYTYINREFAANFWSDCTYINREEDMGVPGIRKAKQSYYPAFMINKYDVALRSTSAQ